jgi:hypothetical protein
MVYVRLEQEWTDGAGVSHSAGESVDVDAATLATLQAEGIVGEVRAEWAGPTSDDTVSTQWAGPTSAPA